ncbi:universal stress protein [Spartinivicinus poritis]|uniref:Universal stress protein n=1 Tax=Spartinivicinus poritis TaxID=2994640 RepID=A0ABT5U374_9GAMM|nr:universal stress protein [Spartinivicinus sp. A2-2]MDE1460822.1 universal stress protein [Spartinivicinus sp. A2-2]
MNLLQINTIIVPVDFSEECTDAVKSALELAESPQKVTVVHVKYPVNYVTAGTAFVQMDEERHQKEVEAYLQQYIQKHNWQGINSVVLSGDPGSEIAEYARNVNASLVVISSHGYHGFKRFMLGSVAERVIRFTTCPTLVLKR